MERKKFQKGRDLLMQPVLPLVSMVGFLYLTGPFTTVAEVIDEMPEPVETGYTCYDHPRELLRNHLNTLVDLETLKNGQGISVQIVDPSGEPVDPMTAVSAWVSQRILESELEMINSFLCGPCGCTLCCIGPDQAMEQEFFEIPLRDDEVDLFSIPRHDNAESRHSRPMDEENILQVNGTPFYRQPGPRLFHWQGGWSLILPIDSSCPGLAGSGRCRLYKKRPMVCRRPQIFSYILEKTGHPNKYCLRSSLLAVMDCPYVQALQKEIGAYAAACELEPVFRRNKK